MALKIFGTSSLTTPRFLPLHHIVGLKKYLLRFVFF